MSQPNKSQKDYYLKLLDQSGIEGIYRKAIGKAFLHLPDESTIDLNLMDLSDSFFSLHKQTGEEKFFQIGKALRRAAHMVYRELMRMNKRKPKNIRFLNVVQ